jgi:glutamyl-tRNA reductase
MRELEAPMAKQIINTHITEFIEWFEMRKNVPALNIFKNKLKEI